MGAYLDVKIEVGLEEGTEREDGGRAERRRKGEQDRTYLNINCKNVGMA